MTPPEIGAFLADPRSFGRRLKRVQSMIDPAGKVRAMDRLLEMFGAERVYHRGIEVGYRLPDGQWFCRKKAYNSEREATDALRRIRERAGRSLRRVYLCPQCGKFHHSHRPARRSD